MKAMFEKWDELIKSHLMSKFLIISFQILLKYKRFTSFEARIVKIILTMDCRMFSEESLLENIAPQCIVESLVKMKNEILK